MNVILYIFSFYLIFVYKCDFRLILKVLILWGDSGEGGNFSAFLSIFLIQTHPYTDTHIRLFTYTYVQ